jgi:spore germination cell wall hydrolase CwlJ-like protein
MALLQTVALLLTANLAHGQPAADPGASRCLALTLYWEARSGGRDGMIAVGWVVLNRRNHPEFPNSICEVVRQGGEDPPCQFSYWCDGEPETPQNSELWKLAQQTAAQLLTNPSPDPTGGALYFHSVDIPVPWKVDRERTVRIGDHVFYR